MSKREPLVKPARKPESPPDHMATALEMTSARLADAEKQIALLHAAIDDLKNKLPGRLRRISPEGVAAILQADRTASFEVLEEYRFQEISFRKGQQIEAKHYKRLLDHVHNGLSLGPVVDSSKEVEKYLAVARAKERAAAAALEFAAAEATKAAVAAQAKAEEPELEHPTPSQPEPEESDGEME